MMIPHGTVEITVYMSKENKQIADKQMEFFMKSLDYFLAKYSQENKLINFQLDEVQRCKNE